jgi:purine-binding chemotaxis protein CheW
MALGKNLKKDKAAVPDKEVKAPKPVLATKKLKQSSTFNQSISHEEYERRMMLQKKFHEEISLLKDKQVHLVLFGLGSTTYAIEISKVAEVVVTPQLTKMPSAPAYIPGIGTVRGKSILMIDLAAKLGLVPSESNFKDRIGYSIIVKSERFLAGVLVPSVPLNQKIMGNQIVPVAQNIAESTEEESYIKGIISTKEGSNAFFIDIDELIEGDRLKARVVEKTTSN